MAEPDLRRLLESVQEITANLNTLKVEMDLLSKQGLPAEGITGANPDRLVDSSETRASLNTSLDPEWLPLRWLQDTPIIPPLGVDIGELLGPVFDRLAQLLRIDRFIFFQWEPEKNRLVPRVSRGFRRDDLTSFSLGPGEGITGRAFHEGRPIVASAGSLQNGDDPLLSRFPVREAIVLPVRSDAGRGGVLYAGRTSTIPFEVRDLALLELLAERIVTWVHVTTFLQDHAYRLKAAEEQLIRLEKAQALSEIARGIAHDFNNVLAIILGTTELMRTRVQNASTREGLEVIEEAAWRGAEAVRRLQGFAVTAGKEEFVTVDLNAIVLDAVAAMRPRWKDETEAQCLRVEVVTDLGEVPPILGNPIELREMVINLLFNALEAMPEGGRVVIASRRWEERVEMSVSDTGVGMSEEICQRIFNPFFTTKGPQRLGLGLAVVHRVLVRHRGQTEVSSQEGQGTTFVIRFPASSAPLTTETTPTTAGTPQPEANPPDLARILVIENEVLLRAVLVDILMSLGHTVRWAPDGQEGLALFKQEEFDVVFTDLSMPEVSGWEVARGVKKMNPRVPVILVTGWGNQLDSKRLVESGVDLVVAKPFQMERVLSALSNALALRRLPT